MKRPTGIGPNFEYERLKKRRETLRERCASLIEAFATLVDVVVPDVRSRYMVAVGQLESRVYELKVEINRWRRRFAMRQAALNRGGAPDYPAIEAALDAEFADYMETIRKNLEEIRKSVLHCASETLSEEETAALRRAYHDAAKKLHPDLNPDLPESAKALWLQIQKAHADNDWKALSFLTGLVDDVVSGEDPFESAEEDAMEDLAKSVAAIERKCEDLRKRMDEIENRPPVSYRGFLADAAKVEERRAQLRAQTEALEKIVGEYEELWKNGR